MGNLAPDGPVKTADDRYYTVWDVCRSCGTIVDDSETLRCPRCGSVMEQRLPARVPLVPPGGARLATSVLLGLIGVSAVLLGVFVFASGLVHTGALAAALGLAILTLGIRARQAPLARR